MVTEILKEFGIEQTRCWSDCPPGWDNLLREALTWLQKHPDWTPHGVAQVKEKFGRLTIYVDFGGNEVDVFLYKISDKSMTVCEECGAKAELRCFGGWYTTLCDEHYNDRQRLLGP